MIEFTGKNIIITGGSRGIGRATALAFAEAGANVAFTYHQNDEAAQEVEQAIRERGGNAIAWKAATTDMPRHEELLESVVSRWGSLDVVVSNAGIWSGAPIDEMRLGEFREMMDVNMTGTFILAKLATKQMKLQRSGAMVIISSTAGQRGEAEHSHYAAAKGAQISFTKSLASELASFGIRVNCVAPGWVATEMTRAAMENPETMLAIENAIPLGRPARPEEIANAILFIASPLASFITGEILNVNGGAVLCG